MIQERDFRALVTAWEKRTGMRRVYHELETNEQVWVCGWEFGDYAFNDKRLSAQVCSCCNFKRVVFSSNLPTGTDSNDE